MFKGHHFDRSVILLCVRCDLPLKFHPAAVRAPAGDTPCGVTGARGQRAEPVRCAA
jgi:hypothetical protein